MGISGVLRKKNGLRRFATAVAKARNCNFCVLGIPRRESRFLNKKSFFKIKEKISKNVEKSLKKIFEFIIIRLERIKHEKKL